MIRFIPTNILVLAEAMASRDKVLPAFKSDETIRLDYIREAKDLHKRIASRGWHVAKGNAA